jgi:hypothetical protein
MLYLGVLIIPESRLAAAFDALNQDRCAVGYHRELHFKTITQHHKAELARRWLDRVLYDERKIFHFHALGVDVRILSASAFGGGPGWKQKAYTRLFRSAVVYAMKSFFTAGVDVSLVVHDRADVEHDPFFDWHALWRINLDHGIRCDGSRIQFCDSDHTLPGVDPCDSNMIQLTDLLLGATRLGLEATSGQQHKVAVAERWIPLLARLTDERLYRNPNSRYRHVGRCSVSFFPSRALTKAELASDIERARSHFYVSRRPRLLDRHQLAFDI